MVDTPFSFGDTPAAPAPDQTKAASGVRSPRALGEAGSAPAGNLPSALVRFRRAFPAGGRDQEHPWPGPSSSLRTCSIPSHLLNPFALRVLFRESVSFSPSFQEKENYGD